MATETTEHRDNASLASLVGNIISDAQELTRQQIDLFKVEIRDNTEKAKSIGMLFGAGLAVAIVAVVLLAFAAAGGLAHAFPDLPTWAAQGIVGLVLAAVAGILFGVCKSKVDSFHVVPEKAVEAMKENLEWKTKPN